VGQVAGVIYRTFTWGSYLNNGKAGLGWSVTLLVDLFGLSMNHSKAGGVSRSHSPKEASSCLNNTTCAEDVARCKPKSPGQGQSDPLRRQNVFIHNCY
jgi:hypothetical protein